MQLNCNMHLYVLRSARARLLRQKRGFAVMSVCGAEYAVVNRPEIGVLSCHAHRAECDVCGSCACYAVLRRAVLCCVCRFDDDAITRAKWQNLFLDTVYEVCSNKQAPVSRLLRLRLGCGAGSGTGLKLQQQIQHSLAVE